MKPLSSYLHTLFSGVVVFFLSGVYIVFALDTIASEFPPQSASSLGSNNNQVWFSTGAASTGTTSYINKDNDSTTLGNYLRGYYYDTQFGFFELDWNTLDTSQNVRVTGSTNKCATGYGYILGGFAKSDTAGYIQFNHDADNFVYFCESDQKLHGWAYSEHLGFQSFEGIAFTIVTLATNPQTYSTGGTASYSDPFFTNNNSFILMGLPENIDSFSSVQGRWIARKQWQEVLFYIIK